MDTLSANTQLGRITVKGVSIGDRFYDPINTKNGAISTVVDFVERRSMVRGNVFDYECISQYEFLGEKMTRTVSFSTVIRFKQAQ